ncbi:hypothetical protein A2U01_0114275 [Trifolium medium]|uniref:Uncharacterized protein n=1 Tax=Trifolium medium TaxID=97028 RepID=A0A392VYC2_9FABA|nr:hypothetical protein [Trifolium medium]
MTITMLEMGLLSCSSPDCAAAIAAGGAAVNTFVLILPDYYFPML